VKYKLNVLGKWEIIIVIMLGEGIKSCLHSWGMFGKDNGLII